MADTTDVSLVCMCWLISKMLDKFFFSCLVFTFAGSTVSDISLDYYFGFDDTLRSGKYLENCNSRRTQETCQTQCGPDHACLLGKCFCVSVKPPIKKNDENSNIARVDNKCNKLHTRLRALDEFLEKARTKFEDREDPSSESDSSSEESESTENEQDYMRLAEMALRPSLRHHIAHFCPNLDIARKCIRKCMERGKPAFCGKDHVCYCGHRYDTHHDDIKVSTETYSPFKDLYEKYFGPRDGQKSLKGLNLMTSSPIENLSTNTTLSSSEEEITTTTESDMANITTGSDENMEDTNNDEVETAVESVTTESVTTESVITPEDMTAEN